MARRLALALLAAIVLIAPAFPAFAAGSAGVISVSQNSATSAFPKQLSFHLRAASSAPISSVRIAYRAGDDPVITVASVPFIPANRINASYQIDLGQEYYPPGVTIQYQWRITAQNGAQLTTDWENLTVVDPRFTWHEKTLGVVTLHWYQGSDQFAEAVLARATQTLASASATAQTAPTKPVQIYLYANLSDFQAALGANTDQWVGGQTYPLYRLIILYAPPNDLVDAQRSVAHEMTHIAVDSTSEDPYGPLPTWLDEGMAVVAEGQLDPTFQKALDAAVRSGTLMSMYSISGNFPESNTGATLAYAESASLVAYFREQYGQAKLAALIAAFRQGDSADQAFQRSIGESPTSFRRAWEANLRQQMGLPAVPATPPAPQHSWLTTVTSPITFVVSLIEDLARLVQTAKG